MAASLGSHRGSFRQLGKRVRISIRNSLPDLIPIRRVNRDGMRVMIGTVLCSIAQHGYTVTHAEVIDESHYKICHRGTSARTARPQGLMCLPKTGSASICR
jgi:hypothetical protein